MKNQYINEAPYHPGYEDASFKNEAPLSVTELAELRRVNARYLAFSNTIIDFCTSELNHRNAEGATTQ
jgi:hypothetical protein|uniref:hypothetical protein n=1 Tax=Polynucleobacter sp. TaxID=2029855 RepID=UPI00404779E6